MTSNNDDLEIDVKGEPAQLLLATVGSSSSAGVTLIFDGTDTPTQKRYKRVTSQGLSSNNRVLVAKISGTFVVIGKLS